MLVFAAHVPHSPLLLESINKDRFVKMAETRKAMALLADELYAVHPDTILLLSEHPTVYADAFSINVHDPYRFDMSEFGHFDEQRTLRPDMPLIDRIQRSVRKNNQPLTLNTDESLNYASAVAIELLTAQLPKVKLVPITYTSLDAKSHFQFGQALKDAVIDSPKRVAIIVAGDSSHALSNDSPSGFHPSGPAYDEKMKELLIHKNTTGLLLLDETFVREAHVTNYKLLCILFGLLENISLEPEILSYEAPFGVGYLVVNFVIK